MAGAYCQFCDHRCFVSRVMPGDARWMPGQTVHLATCPRGSKHDTEKTGYNYVTAINPAMSWPGPCPCECNSGGFCGGCGHAGCGGRR